MKLSDAIYSGSGEIKNIIFDWGGVITDLHFQFTKDAFRSMGLFIFDEHVPHDPLNNVFIPFETGRITTNEFHNRLQELAGTQVSDEMIDNAWNAMLGNLPEDRWKILERAGKFYRTFLLSNTNAVHVPYYFKKIQEMYGVPGYTHLFEKTYFSFELGMRKPDAEIFEYVLRDSHLMPEETLFIDDFIENIESAKRLGMHTVHIQPPITLTQVFSNWE